MFPAVVQPQTDDVTSAPTPTSFGECMKCHESFPGISPMAQGTSRPGSSQMRLGSMKPKSNMSISGLEVATERNMSHLLKVKPDEPVSLYPCI